MKAPVSKTQPKPVIKDPARKGNKMEKEQLIELLEEMTKEFEKSMEEDNLQTDGIMFPRYYDIGKIHAIENIAFLLKMNMNQEEARQYLKKSIGIV